MFIEFDAKGRPQITQLKFMFSNKTNLAKKQMYDRNYYYISPYIEKTKL